MSILPPVINPDPVQVSDVGFTPLHDGGLNPQLDIIFIHGIQGHPRETWSYSHSIAVPQSAKPKFTFLGIGSRSRTPSPSRGRESPNPPDPLSGLWPAKILSLDFPNARILTYGYDSSVSNFFSGPASQNDMVTIAAGFLNDLAAERVAARKRPLIIVSHSMGGLITKEALRRASTEPKENADLRDILESTTALVFFGTPHRGGAYTNLGLTATKIAKAAGFDVSDQNIRDLKGSSPVLTLIRQGFAPLLDSDKFKVSTLQESLGYKGTGLLNGKIVPNESSELGHRNERVNLINANHMDMCRFKDKNDDGYRKFKAEIARHILRLQENVQQITPEDVRHDIWKSDPSTRPTYELSSEEFSANHQDDLDQDYPDMTYWYREKLDPNTLYPVGVEVESRFNRPGGIVPVGNTVLTLRRVCNILVRARFRYILPGKYQIRWVFWFPAGRSCPPSNRSVPSGYIPDVDSTENSVLQRIFPSVVTGKTLPNPDSGFGYPCSLLLHAGRPRNYSEFMEVNIDVDKHPFAAPELLLEDFKQQSLDPGLWNTWRNTGWCEISGSIVEVNDAGRIALVISKKFERRWVGGFSFGGVRLRPI